MKSIVLSLLLIGIFLGLTLPQTVFAQALGIDQLINQLRFTHSQLLGDIDQVKQLVKSNNTSEALNLLDDMDVKVDQMNGMFNDLVWQASNRGH
jgi:uncharacterized protein YoxC